MTEGEEASESTADVRCAVAKQYAKTDSSSGTTEVLEHTMIMTSLEHHPFFRAFKSDFVHFLSDRYTEISKQVTGTRFVLSKF